MLSMLDSAQNMYLAHTRARLVAVDAIGRYKDMPVRSARSIPKVECPPKRRAQLWQHYMLLLHMKMQSHVAKLPRVSGTAGRMTFVRQ